MHAQLTPHHATPATLGGMAALIASPGRAGRGTVLLVPGYTGSKEDFAPLLDPLADAGLTAVALDLPGQHESPGPDDEDAYLPAALGALVAKVAGDLDPQPVVLLGHSFGGLVARAAVLAGADVAGLVLLCSGPSALPLDGPRRALLDAGEPVLREHGVPALQRIREARDAITGVTPVSPEVGAFLKRRFLASSAAGLLGMANGLRGEPDRCAELAAALGPAARLVVRGADDDAWPEPIQQDMARRLGAELVTIDGAAHSPAVENPAGLLAALLPRLTAWTERPA